MQDKIKTLEELSHDTFYKMENYSQLVIDFVDEVEELFEDEVDPTSFGAMRYKVENVLDVIDKSRTHDIEALKSLSVILKIEHEKYIK